MPSRCGHRPSRVAVAGWCGLPVNVALSQKEEASLEVLDVSREFPRATVLKFSVSSRQNDTLCYK